MYRIVMIVLLAAGAACAQPALKTKNVFIVTLDGMRWQEVFGGADARLVGHAPIVEDSLALKKAFWAETPQQRREMLMPFVWQVVAKQGQLHGNRWLGSKVNVTNGMWFSYPGYSEILTGVADDKNINSNDHYNNPNINVLEVAAQQPGFKGKVAAFGSWDCFPWILNISRNGLPVNAGKIPTEKGNDRELLMNSLMNQLPDISGSTRLDAFTYRYAFEYVKQHHPRLFFMSFDETDHWAHEGRYEHYLAAARYSDDFIRELWTWLQQQPAYRDQTTLIITTDHGRGGDNREDWKHHGAKVKNADQIWMAVMGPDTPATGESSEGQRYQSQVARTVSTLLGFSFDGPAAPVIPGAIRK